MDRLVDLRELKAEARRLYPPGHPVREVLSREPDFMPAGEADVKFPTFLRLLFATRQD